VPKDVIVRSGFDSATTPAPDRFEPGPDRLVEEEAVFVDERPDSAGLDLLRADSRTPSVGFWRRPGHVSGLSDPLPDRPLAEMTPAVLLQFIFKSARESSLADSIDERKRILDFLLAADFIAEPGESFSLKMNDYSLFYTAAEEPGRPLAILEFNIHNPENFSLPKAARWMSGLVRSYEHFLAIFHVKDVPLVHSKFQFPDFLPEVMRQLYLSYLDYLRNGPISSVNLVRQRAEKGFNFFRQAAWILHAMDASLAQDVTQLLQLFGRHIDHPDFMETNEAFIDVDAPRGLHALEHDAEQDLPLQELTNPLPSLDLQVAWSSGNWPVSVATNKSSSSHGSPLGRILVLPSTSHVMRNSAQVFDGSLAIDLNDGPQLFESPLALVEADPVEGEPDNVVNLFAGDLEASSANAEVGLDEANEVSVEAGAESLGNPEIMGTPVMNPTAALPKSALRVVRPLMLVL